MFTDTTNTTIDNERYISKLATWEDVIVGTYLFLTGNLQGF